VSFFDTLLHQITSKFDYVIRFHNYGICGYHYNSFPGLFVGEPSPINISDVLENGELTNIPMFIFVITIRLPCFKIITGEFFFYRIIPFGFVLNSRSIFHSHTPICSFRDLIIYSPRLRKSYTHSSITCDLYSPFYSYIFLVFFQFCVYAHISCVCI